MRRYISLFLLLPLLGLSTVLGQQKETLEFSSFTSLKVVGKVELVAEKGTSNKLELEVRGISRDKVQIKNTKGELKIKVGLLLNTDYTVIAHLTYEELDNIHASAGAMIEVEDVLPVDILNLHAGSGAEIEVETEADVIYQRAAEGAIIRVGGKAERAEIRAATGGMVRAEDLQVKAVLAKVTTGGEIEIHVEEELDVHSSTGGEFLYSGNPSKSYTQSSLGGVIRRD